MRPLPDNNHPPSSISSSQRRPTMRLRDPLTTYKSFESSTGASASPSPSANGQHSNASTIKSNHHGFHQRPPSQSPSGSSTSNHRHHQDHRNSATTASPSPSSQHHHIHHNHHRDSQSSATSSLSAQQQQQLLLHRTTSLDSLANSSEDPEDDINTTTTEEDDVCCDDDDLSDVDSIGDFGSTITATTTTTTAQIHHRKSDLESLQPDDEESVTPQPAVIKAYLEKTAQRNSNYKVHEFKRRPDASAAVAAAEEERKRAEKLFARDLEETFAHHEMSVDSDDTGSNQPSGTMSSTVTSSSGGGSGSLGSGGGSSGSVKSSTRRLSVASSGSMGRMETIIEEPPAIEVKVSVKEILARFETLNSLEIQSKTSTLSSGARAAAQTLNVPIERLEAQVHVSASTNAGNHTAATIEKRTSSSSHHIKSSLTNGGPTGHLSPHQQQQHALLHHQQQQQQHQHHDEIMEYNVQSMSPTSGGGRSSGAFIMQPEQMMHQQQQHSHHQQQQQQHMSKRTSGGGGVHHGGELHHDEIMMHHHHPDDEDGSTIVANGNGTSSAKYSLLQFAMQHFRNDQTLEDHPKNGRSSTDKQRSTSTALRPHADLVKWQGAPIRTPLLRLPPDLSPLALECFECILRYCGDLPPDPELTEVKCVYTVLMHCHKHLTLRDEVYCQLMKQTTANRSPCTDSSQRAWRLLSVLAAYFGCSDALKPYLLEHLSAAASDRRRSCHGTAAVCLTNLRKTARCGGRKNVPSVEEVTAVSAGRSARRQIYRLPGGAERVVNTRCSTVVADVIAELCALLGIDSPTEQQEFSLYCIVQGDAFTMPLASDEYILDVTTELLKSGQPFYLIFCRSVWHFQLRRDPAPTPLYIEVLFNQVAPDYLEGLLLELPNGGAPNPDVVRDMARIAALLHRAADLNHVPAMKEIKFLLPKPALGIRELRPAQWVALVQSAWPSIASLMPGQVKAQFLSVLSSWSLFGSSFFAVKRVWAEDSPADEANPMWRELILALNRRGILFLDPNTHETLQHWPFMEVISTRKVRSEDGALFLDMKVGNLMQQRVIRVQTEQAHEISRLVRQYITMAQGGQQRNGRD